MTVCEIRSSIFSHNLDRMWNESGGAMLSFNSNVTVASCTFHSNGFVGEQYRAFVPQCVTQTLPT